MFSVAVVEPGRLELVEIPKPMPGPYQVRIKTEVSSLCNSTDRKLIDGHFPGVEHYPILLGHESVGLVESVGKKVRTFKLGDRVVGGLLLNSTDSQYESGWGGFSEYIIAGDHQAMAEDDAADPEHSWNEIYQTQRVVPKTISPEEAVMLCTWREVYAAFDDFNLQKGDDVLIFGAGPVGLSFTRFAKLLRLGYVGVVDRHPSKLEKAAKLGAEEVLAPDARGLDQLLQRRHRPLDAVIDAVGSQEIINSALSLVKMGGSVCVYGVIDKTTISLEISHAPYNFNLLVHQWPTRLREAAAQEPLCKWISQNRLSHTDFISAEFPISKIEEAVELLNSRLALKILLRY